MQYISVKKEHSVATITLNRPPANALARPLLEELHSLLTDLETDLEVKVIILHGEGRFFAAGADIKEFISVKSKSEFAEMAAFGQQVFQQIEQLAKPVIAAIHGAALGGGLELAMACHIRIVSENAKLGLPELQLGIVPGFGGSQRLPRLVGVGKATEMILTSEPVTGQEAVILGLANHAYPEEEVMEKAYELAKKIAQKSTVTVRATLELLEYATDDRFQEGCEKEVQVFGKLYDTYDAKEGISAFIEKRKPDFKDK